VPSAPKAKGDAKALLAARTAAALEAAGIPPAAAAVPPAALGSTKAASALFMALLGAPGVSREALAAGGVQALLLWEAVSAAPWAVKEGKRPLGPLWLALARTILCADGATAAACAALLCGADTAAVRHPFAPLLPTEDDATALLRDAVGPAALDLACVLALLSPWPAAKAAARAALAAAAPPFVGGLLATLLCADLPLELPLPLLQAIAAGAAAALAAPEPEAQPSGAPPTLRLAAVMACLSARRRYHEAAATALAARRTHPALATLEVGLGMLHRQLQEAARGMEGSPEAPLAGGAAAAAGRLRRALPGLARTGLCALEADLC